MAEAEILKFNNGTFEIADKKARSQLNNIANQLGKNEDGTDIELPTTNKTVKGSIVELFQNVSNGKQLIATAITDKGVATSSDSTFQTMATNIGNIQTGSGTVTTDIQNTLNKCGAKKMRFGVLSDIHLKADTSHTYNIKFANALTKLKELGCNFLTICGDLCNYDRTNEFATYKSMIEGYGLEIYEVMGNHDAGTGTGTTEDEWLELTGNNRNFELVQDDEVFLFLSQKKWEDYSASDNNKMITENDKTWLVNKLEQYKSKSRIFLFHHQYLGDCDGFEHT